jgi:phage terminase large subunit GpA-like protein
MQPKAQRLTKRLLARLKPPDELKLSEWAESNNIQLPADDSARPGPYRNWPYMREILDVIGDTQHERVSIMKSARLGYTKGLMIAMGAYAATNPTRIMLLMPTDEDAAEISVDEVEPMFEANKVLKGLLKKSNNGANNLRNKQFVGGGSLKIRSGRAPRKLRRLNVKVLLIDEADAFEVTKEGDAISLAEARTLTNPDRKIVVGSTPKDEGASVVESLFENGDQRIYEVPCPKCGVFCEIVWEQITWEYDDSGHNVVAAHWNCPHCHNAIPERWKPQMVENGRWRKLRPDVRDHASFRINALVSLIANASWVKLAKMHQEAIKEGPSKLKVFRNTILGLPWRLSINKIDSSSLMDRVEPWGLGHARRLNATVPADVLMILAGADVQDDRVEVTLLGVGIDGSKFVLGHKVFPGNTLEPRVWRDLDLWHRDFSIRHPNGWLLGIDAMAVDSGGREGRTQVVYDWTGERIQRMIYAIKGESGPNKRAWRKAQKVKGGARLAILAVDLLKTQVHDSLGAATHLESGDPNPHCLRFSDQLQETWFEQVTNETRSVKHVERRPVIYWRPKREGVPVEALDCTAYAFGLLENPAVKLIDLHGRWMRKPTPVEAGPRKKRPTLAEIAAQMNGGT